MTQARPTDLDEFSATFRDVSFSYGRRQRPVVAQLSWSVPVGRTVLLGPNGAGKSTLLGMLSTALRPASGSIEIAGQSSSDRLGRREIRRMVGWMPQTIDVISQLRVREQVAYAGWLKGLDKRTSWEQAATALERVDLLDLQNTRVTRLSGGQLRRVGLAQALVHQPEVLLLDEPTAGLDPSQRARFREVMSEIKTRCLIVSTHQVDDISELFDYVVVVNGGAIAFQGSVPTFLEMTSSRPAAAGTDRWHNQAERAYAIIVGE